MTVVVEIAGRRRMVAVEPLGPVTAAGGRFRLVLVANADAPPAAGRDVVHEVDVRVTDTGLSILYPGSQRSVDVSVTELANGQSLVQFARVAVTATAGGRRLARDTAAGASTGDVRVMAPMPGRVLRVLVKPGDEVAARQGLVVVEAMKMENELAAPRAGRVREVAAAEGTPVEAGRLLVVIE